MRIVHERAIGLDVHSKTIKACLDYADSDVPGARSRQLRTFETFTDSLQQLAGWVDESAATVVAMESTGQYWKPPWRMIRQRCPRLTEQLLVNPGQIQQVPGRKSDTSDSAWIAELAAYGLLRGSLVPSDEIYQLRDLTRHRHKLTQQRSAEASRALALLESAGIKIGIVASSMTGVSVRHMMNALIEGERDVDVLADLAMARMRRKIPQLRRATAGYFTGGHADRLKVIIDSMDFYETQIQRLSDQVTPLMAPFAETAALLMTVPGFGVATIETLIAQTTGDMSHFRDQHHLASWACMCPGNYESAGKRKSGRPRKGNPELRHVLTEAGWATRRTDTYHGALYRHLTRTLGNNNVGRKKAAFAAGHSLLCASYFIMRDNIDYHDLGADYFDSGRDPDKEAARLIKRLQKLTGKNVVLTPAA